MRPSRSVSRYFQFIGPPIPGRIASAIDQSRNSSLIEVFARVFSSTRFTITAQ
jgi:hypothetical protein